MEPTSQKKKLPDPQGFAQYVIDHMADAVFWAQADGKLVYVNEAACSSLGYQKEELLQLKVTDVASPVSEHSWKDKWAAMKQSGTMVFESFHKTKTGEIFPVEVHVSFLEYEHEDYVCGIVHEISERKTFLEELKISEEKFATVFNNSPDVIILTSMDDGRIIDINDSVNRLSGFSREEVIGKTTVELDYWVNLDHRAQYLHHLAKYKRISNFETEIRRKNRKPFAALVSGEVITLHGKTCVLSVIHDISGHKESENALRESENKYHVLFSDSPDSYLIFEGGTFVDCNKAAEKMLKGTREQIIGKSPRNLSPEYQPNGRRSDEWIAEILDDLIVSGHRTFDWVHLACDGTEVNVEISVTTINLNGKKALFNSWRDISERKAAEKIQQENETRLRELNATKDKFFSIIAHDLKSPFNSIIGFSNLLAEQVREKDYDGIESYAEIIQRSSNRAMNLLKNLLDWSRVQTGRMEFNPEYLEIVHLINDEILLLSDLAKHKSIIISGKLPRNAPVFADRQMVSTIIRNLLSNALRFTKPGGMITVSLLERPENVEISVADTGIGMKHDILEKLFRIDESFSTSDTTNERGTGLGLILCHEFIIKHEGTIWAESTPNAGSVFHFSLPKK